MPERVPQPGRGLHLLSENIDTTTPPGEMIFTVMASLAQFEARSSVNGSRREMVRARAGQADLPGADSRQGYKRA